MTALSYNSKIYSKTSALTFRNTPVMSINTSEYKGYVSLSMNGNIFVVTQRSSVPAVHNIQINETQFLIPLQINSAIPVNIASLTAESSFISSTNNSVVVFIVTTNTVVPTASTVDLNAVQNNLYISFGNSLNNFLTIINGYLTLGNGTPFSFDKPTAFNTNSTGAQTTTNIVDVSNNQAYYPTFVATGATGNQQVYTGTSVGINPGTGAFITNRIGTANNLLVDTQSIAIGTNAINSGAGDVNIAIGDHALSLIDFTNAKNIAIGVNAASNLSGGLATDNIAIGFNAMRGNFTNSNCIAIGSNSMLNGSNTSIAIGSNSLANSNNSLNQVAVGDNALNRSTGTGNVGVGYNTLAGLITGDRNIAIGQYAGSNVINAIGTISIGNMGTGNSYEISIGDPSNTACYLTPPIISNMSPINYNTSTILLASDLISPSGGLIISSGNVANINFTLPNASTITTLLPGITARNTFQFVIVNANTSTITMLNSGDASFSVGILPVLAAGSRNIMTVYCNSVNPSLVFTLY